MKKIIGLTTLVMINLLAIGSLNNLPSVATVGLSSVSYYLLALLLFFLPYSLITAELASGYSEESGIYVWVRDAFGPLPGFVAVWLQWIENIIWYPTILSFIAGALSYLIDPALASNKLFNVLMTIGIYWMLTLINFFGLRISALVSVWGSIIGMLVPSLLLIGFGGFQLFVNHTSQLHFCWQSLIPSLNKTDNLAFLVGIALTLAGLEMSATHSQAIRNARSTIPLAIGISAIAIMIVSVLGSLAIAVLLPANRISLNNGVTQSIAVFLDQYSSTAILKYTAIIALAIGGIASASTWVFGAISNLDHLTKDHCIPEYLNPRDHRHGNKRLMLLQAVCVTLLCSAFIFVPSVNNAYWMLTAIAGQLYLLMYLFLFTTAIILRYRKSLTYAYKIGGIWTTYLISVWGIIGGIILFLLAFLLPTSLSAMDNKIYHQIQCGSLLVAIIAPIIIYYFTKLRKAKDFLSSTNVELIQA